MYLSPRLLVWPKRSSPPLEFRRGVISGQTANSRPNRNREGSTTVSAMALAPMTPTPGTVVNKRLTRLCRYHLARHTSISLPIVPFSWSTIDCRIQRTTSGSRSFLMSNCLRQDLDMPETLRCNDAEFGHVSAQWIEQHRSLPDQKAARPMQHQHGLLLGALHRHEPH